MTDAAQQVEELNKAAIALYERGDYEQALTLAHKALRLANQPPADRTQRVVTLNNLGLILTALGEFSAAGRCYAQVLDALAQSPGTDQPARAIMLGNIAAFYQETGRFAEARKLYEEAADIISRSVGEGSEEFAIVSANLGDLCEDLGEYEDSERHLGQALSIYRRLDDADHSADVVRVLNTLAALHKTRGDYPAAESLFREALDLERTTSRSNPSLHAALLNNFASLQKNLGRFREAGELYRQALDLWQATLGPSHPNVASALNNLAELSAQTDDLEQAAKYYGQALALRRAAFGPVHADIADTLNGLASVSYRIHDYGQAATRYELALQVRRSTLPARHPAIAQALNNLGAVYLSTGEFERAEPLLRDALEIDHAALGDNHPVMSLHLYNLASSCVGRGHAPDALPLLQRAATIDGGILDQVFSLSSDAQRLGYLTEIRWRLHWFLSLVVDHLRTDPAVQQALDLVLRRKALGAEALAAQRDAVLGGRYPDLRESLASLTAVRAEIAVLTLTMAATGEALGRRERMADLRTREDTLDTQLARQIPEIQVDHHLRGANCRTVAAALPTGSILVEFVRSERFVFEAEPAHGQAKWQPARYLAFLLPAGAPDDVTLLDLGDADLIDRSIATFTDAVAGVRSSRQSLSAAQPVPPDDEAGRGAIRNAARELASESTRPDTARVWSAANALRRMVFDPLVPSLQRRTRLILAPDGDLARVPFQALPTPDGGHVLDTYMVSYLSVGRDALRFQAAVAPVTGQAVVAADPDFDLGGAGGEPGKPFRRLSGTRTEGEQVARRLGCLPFMGAAVVDEQMKSLRAPRILHIATHGFFVPTSEPGSGGDYLLQGDHALAGPLAWLSAARDPLLRSGLALAGANTWLAGGQLPPKAEDGLLLARDVAGLDLLGTELVVLSACETGLGQVQLGEGVFGLRRAFAVAGARAVVMSLWKVPDLATATLMDFFYEQLQGGLPASEALRMAQAALKRDGHDVYAWGAFICQGVDLAPEQSLRGLQPPSRLH